MIDAIKVSKRALKDLQKVPFFIADKLDAWIHDEPLKGNRKGQRSIRLNRHYRAIYVIKKETIEFVEIQEVTKHEY